MTLEFIERMRKRQNAKRLKEREKIDRAAGTDKKFVGVTTAKGFLLDETGKPCAFPLDKYNPTSAERYAIARASAMTQAIDDGGMGLLYPDTMIDYYKNIQTLEPVR